MQTELPRSGIYPRSRMYRVFSFLIFAFKTTLFSRIGCFKLKGAKCSWVKENLGDNNGKFSKYNVKSPDVFLGMNMILESDIIENNCLGSVIL